MPTYEFLCEKCQKTFTVIISISEYEKKDYQCPQCKNKDVKQQISSFRLAELNNSTFMALQ